MVQKIGQVNFDALDRSTRAVVEKEFQNQFGSATVFDVKKQLIANAFNSVFDSKHFQVNYIGPFDEQGPKDDEKTLRLPARVELHCDKLNKLDCKPEGTCVSLWTEIAKTELKSATDDCAGALKKLRDVSDSVVTRGCNVCWDLPLGLGKACAQDTNPVLKKACDEFNDVIASADAALGVCRATISLAQKAIDLPEKLGQEFAKRTKVGQAYADACKQYEKIFKGPGCVLTKQAWGKSCGVVQATLDKLAPDGKVNVGEIDWRIAGADKQAVKMQVAFEKAHVDEGLEKAVLTSITANGTARVGGWALITLDKEFLPICPPSPCKGEDCRIPLDSAEFTIQAALGKLGATFGISEFYDPSTGGNRKGFYLEPERFDVTVGTKASTIEDLLWSKAAKLPCIVSQVSWQPYEIAEAVASSAALFKIHLSKTLPVSPEERRIAWADRKLFMPTSWKIAEGTTTVIGRAEMSVEYSLNRSGLAATAGPISSLGKPLDPLRYRHSYILELTSGIGTGAVFARDKSLGPARRSEYFSSPVFLGINYRFRRIGAFTSVMPGPGLGDFGIGFGLKARPSTKIDRLGILFGMTLAGDTKDFRGGPRLMMGASWDVGRLVLRGCEARSKWALSSQERGTEPTDVRPETSPQTSPH